MEYTEKYGYVLQVSGADMVNGTPIYDIKPYLAYADSIEDALGGFTEEIGDYRLNVNYDCVAPLELSKEKLNTLTRILEEDPRPSYIEDENRIYGFPFASFEIKFKVKDKALTVISIEKRKI